MIVRSFLLLKMIFLVVLVIKIIYFSIFDNNSLERVMKGCICVGEIGYYRYMGGVLWIVLEDLQK